MQAKLREDRQKAADPSDVWAGDLVHDPLAARNRLRGLTTADTHSRFCAATDARFAYRGEDVVQALERACRQSGYPKTIRVDNGSKVILQDLDHRAYATAVTPDFTGL